MSTIHNIHGDMTAGTAVLQPTDEIAIWEASTGVPKKLTGAQVAGVSPGVVALTAGVSALTVTQAAHAGRAVTISSTTPIAITLPAATGTGAKYCFVVLASATATAHTIVTATAGETYKGFALMQTTSNAALIFPATATDKTISLNGSTKGGLIGDLVELQDVAAGKWSVKVRAAATGATATPFS